MLNMFQDGLPGNAAEALEGSMLRRLLLAFTLGLAVTSATAAPIVAESLTSGGVQRDYAIFRSNSAAGPRPTVFLLHGGGGTATEMRRYTGFDDLAEAAGIVAVYPQGIDQDWNDPGEDRFLLDLAGQLVARGIADRRRIYIAGLSNGGIMALQMACTHADRIAGIAVVAASLPVGFDCRPQRALPALFISGTADRHVPFAGDPASTLPVEESIAIFARHAGCRTRHARRLPPPVPPDGTRAMLYDYGGCAPGGALESVVVEGGTHAWPGAHPGVAPASIQSPASRAIDANTQIWRFFARQPSLP
jgi:polyhydroxybutyrate depolymerase